MSRHFITLKFIYNRNKLAELRISITLLILFASLVLLFPSAFGAEEQENKLKSYCKDYGGVWNDDKQKCDIKDDEERAYYEDDVCDDEDAAKTNIDMCKSEEKKSDNKANKKACEDVGADWTKDGCDTHGDDEKADKFMAKTDPGAFTVKDESQHEEEPKTLQDDETSTDLVSEDKNFKPKTIIETNEEGEEEDDNNDSQQTKDEEAIDETKDEGSGNSEEKDKPEEVEEDDDNQPNTKEEDEEFAKKLCESDSYNGEWKDGECTNFPNGESSASIGYGDECESNDFQKEHPYFCKVKE